MKSSPSPPQQAEHIRHQQLTPESPRPQAVPSPANIPILVEQMDLNYTAPSYNSEYPSQLQTPNAAASTPFYADPPSTADHRNVEVLGPQTAAYGGMSNQAADTSSIHTFSQQHQPASAGDTAPASGQDAHSAYPFSHDNAYAAQSFQGNPYQTDAHAGPIVDVQALLDSLSPAKNAPSTQYGAAIPMQTTPTPSNSSSLPAATNLPPRPPAQDKPATHPNYNPSDDIRSFHPHSQRASNAQPRGNAQSPTLNLQRQDFSATSPSGAQSPTTPNQAPRQHGHRSATPDDEDARWPPEVNRKYEEFLDQERKFVTEGQWDQFPAGSRLFIGNLPTEKVTKRDIFHRFYRHGLLAQISIKQAYGFVQFMDAGSCRRALDAEQGQTVRGRKMHLEISKPQRNTKPKADSHANGARRRSRSPDYTRGGTGPAIRDGRYGGGSGPMSPRDRDRRFRERDDYRPMRSPSPRGSRGMRSRDKSRDRYDSRYRSRSRTPPRRHRSPSPRRGYTEDGLDLPRRHPHEVPDIQILVLNENLPRDFIRWVEDAFRKQNLRSNVLILSGRFPEPAVVRRQILEGVLAIVRLSTTGLAKGKINAQIFDRRDGTSNVAFNEYADLEPDTAALLISNAKQTQSQPVQPPPASYGYGNPPLPQYTQPLPPGFPISPTTQPNVSSLIGSLDPASLSQLLSAMSGNNLPQTPQPAANPALNADLARLLAQVPSSAHTPGYPGAAQPQAANLASAFPSLATLLASQAQPPPQQPQLSQQAPAPPVQTPTQSAAPDMNEIMAQLAQYQR